MKAIITWIRKEPALVVTLVLAVANVAFGGLTEGQEEAVRSIVESIVVLLGGAIVRANVTPTRP